MREIIQSIIDIQNAKGVLNKQSLILQYKDNELFKKFLFYSLNPLLTYKVSEATLLSGIPGAYQTYSFKNIFEICDLLSSRRALDDGTINRVCSFLRIQDSDIQEFYIKLLSKKIRLGITAKTVNKIIPGFIPEWEVQQAYPIEKYPIKNGDWFALTQKLNGVRATYYKGKLIARSGIPFDGLDHITEELSWTENKMVFDGELTLKDKSGLSDNEAFRMATGIINSDGDKSDIKFTIFDAIPTEEFEVGVSSENYKERRINYLNYFTASLPMNGCIDILPVLYSGTDQNKILELLDLMVKEDKEGLIANLNTPYKRTRHKGILKVKRFYTMDLPILRCEEGAGRLKGTLGALVVDFNGNEVNVGSGFTDQERTSFWMKRDELIGEICEIKYKEISKDKNTNNESLQFPVFVSIRNDKTEINIE